ncbi:MAG: 1-acyl-sn-glycerol-3-phosphate acyltransferase [Myxococcota bacterium]|jgi:1-acyl-sn-glycerol-3-phosphate acyltransferase
MAQGFEHISRGFYGLSPINGIVYRFSTATLRLLGATIWRFRIKGLENLPTDEPYLLLPNHVSLLDPLWIGCPVRRGVRAMASAGLMAVPILGAYLKVVGCFAKKKFTKDKEAMKQLQDFYEQGFTILLYPEGNRSWNGETAQIRPGIGKLIKRLNCKVVFGRLDTAYLAQPRWAKYPRWVPIEMTYDGPYSYSEDQTAEEITAHVQKSLTVSPKLSGNPVTFGWRMAHGLPQYLWACPQCFAMGSLSVSPRSGDSVCCGQCEAEWSVDVESVLNGATTMTVAEAFHRIDDHYGPAPVADAAVHAQSGAALQAAAGTLHRVPRGKAPNELVASGRMEIHADSFRVYTDGELVWQAKLEDLRGISVEIANLLHFRVDGVLYRITIPDESPLKWDHFLRRWRRETVGSEH